MINDAFMNLNGSYAVPDLIPEELTFDDLLNVDSMIMPPVLQETAEWGRKIDNLTIEFNTLSLRLEIEKTKRQRLQSVVRQLKREMSPQCPDMLTIKQDLDKFKEQQNTTNYMLDGENARTNTLAFRSISRICQLLTTMMQGTYVSAEAIDEANILLQELALTVQQFGVHYAASYV